MKKKYYFVLKGYPRISETFIAQEIHLLEKLGYDISIISMRQPRENVRQPINEKILAKTIYLPEYILPELRTVIKYNLSCLARYPLNYLKYFSQCLAKSIFKRNRDSIKRFLQSAWVVGKEDIGSESCHLHSHFVHSPTSIAFNVKRITGVKYSISAHAKDIYTIPESEVIRKVEDSEFLTTCTRFNYEFIQDLMSSEHRSKVHLSYHGIDLDFFKPSNKHCFESQAPYLFCSIGRFVEKKGYDVILKALSLVKKEGVDFIYDLFGSGDMQSDVEALIKQYGLEENVKILGAATHREIIDRLRKKGIFICGSKISSDGDRDGIPNTVAEAMSMELPVIATRVSGIPELIKHKDSGWLIPEKNPEAMAEAILHVVNNHEEAQKISKKARVRVAEFFDASNCIDHVNQLFLGLN